MSRFWYYFLGTGDETVPSRYGRITGDPTPGSLCATGQTVCAVYAIPNGLDPSIPAAINNTLKDYFVASRAAGGAPYPLNDATHFDKPYVYLKQ